MIYHDLTLVADLTQIPLHTRYWPRSFHPYRLRLPSGSIYYDRVWEVDSFYRATLC